MGPILKGPKYGSRRRGKRSSKSGGIDRQIRQGISLQPALSCNNDKEEEKSQPLRSTFSQSKGSNAVLYSVQARDQALPHHHLTLISP